VTIGWLPHAQEIDDNVRIAREFVPFDADRLRTLENRTRQHAAAFTYYKMSHE
jgi:hypothetical protein